MTRFWGNIGINRGTQTTAPGIIENVIEEMKVKGEIRNVKASWSQQAMNDGIRMQHLLSVVTPEDSEIDFNEVVYIVWQGRKWAVTSIQYNRPRVELTMGGLYNG